MARKKKRKGKKAARAKLRASTACHSVHGPCRYGVPLRQGQARQRGVLPPAPGGTCGVWSRRNDCADAGRIADRTLQRAALAPAAPARYLGGWLVGDRRDCGWTDPALWATENPDADRRGRTDGRMDGRQSCTRPDAATTPSRETAAAAMLVFAGAYTRPRVRVKPLGDASPWTLPRPTVPRSIAPETRRSGFVRGRSGRLRVALRGATRSGQSGANDSRRDGLGQVPGGGAPLFRSVESVPRTRIAARKGKSAKSSRRTGGGAEATTERGRRFISACTSGGVRGGVRSLPVCRTPCRVRRALATRMRFPCGGGR